MFLFFIIVGIISVSYFKGKLFYCDDDHLNSSGIYLRGPLAVKYKWDCLNAGALWSNRKYNFDNIGQAAVTLFVMASVSGWADILHYSASSTDID